MTEPIAYWNGQFVPQSEAQLSVFDVGFVMGATLTERVRTYGGRLHFLEPHLARLHTGLTQLGITLPEQDTLPTLVEETLSHNHVASTNDLAVVIVATPGPPGDRPTCGISAVPQPRPEWAVGYEQGWRLETSSVQAVNHTAMPRDIKHRSRLHWFLAGQALTTTAQPAEPLLLDADGTVTESAYSNVLAVQNNTLIAVERGRALPGVTERLVLDLARDLGISVEFRGIGIQELRNSDEVLLTSTGSTIAPVTKIDQTILNGGEPGPMWRRLSEAFSQRLGFDFVRQIAFVRD